MTGGAPPHMICIEDASFIINAQQQQLNQQQHLLEKQQRALAQAQWLEQQNGSSTHSTPRSQPVSRIGSFKSTLPPLSVDLNALNAAHQAHHEAKMFNSQQNSSNHSHNSSGTNFGYGHTTGSNLSSQASSPEHTIKKTPRDEQRRFSDGSMSGMATAAALAATGTGKEDTRASKSLATISRRFVEHFGDADTFEYISGQLHVDDVHDGPAVMNRVDGAAEVLGVHVRRIYELIKILEILSLVAFTGDKRGKFSWRGTKDFLTTLGAIQADGIGKYPDIAYANGVRLLGSSKPPLSVAQHNLRHHSGGGDGGSGHSSTVSTPMDGQTGGMLSPGTVTSTASGGSGVSKLAETHLESIAECDTFSSDAFDRSSLSGAGGRYIHNSNEPDSLELHLEGLSDFHAPQLQSYLDKADLDGSELDAFVQLMAADAAVDDMHMNESTTAGQPKQGKKRTALKKSSKTPSAVAAGSSSGNTPSGNNEEFMVEGICKSFLQLFLVGMDGLSMNFAIQRLIPMEAGQTLSEYNKQNATKIRRVYDVANVLCSLSLINKIPQSQRRKSESHTPQSNNNGVGNGSMNSNNQHRDGGGNNSSSTPLSSGNKGVPAKADAKILEWGSFAPATIREYYINKTAAH